MSEALGPAAFENAPAARYLPEIGRGSHPEYSEKAAEIIDEEVRKLLSAAETRVSRTLRERRDPLVALAEALLAKETLDRAAMLAILGQPDRPATRSTPAAEVTEAPE